MDTFCIPSTFIRDALKEVEAAEDRDALAERRTAIYMCEMITLQITAVQNTCADATIATIAVAVGRGSTDDVATIADYIDLYVRVYTALVPAARYVRNSKHLPTPAKSAVLDLLKNSSEMYGLIKNPVSRNIGTYVNEYNRRADKHQKIAEQLFKALNLPDTVMVRLLD